MILKSLFIFSVFFFSACEKKKVAIAENKSKVTFPAVGNYTISTSSSELSWIGKEITTKIHTGTIDIQNGNLEIDSDSLITGQVSMNMSTINVTDLEGRSKEYLEKHLKSGDFFSVTDHPNAILSFKSKKYHSKDNKITFDGQLSIKSITHPITFEAFLEEGSSLINAKASFSFDRTKYDVKFRSGSFFTDLGDKLILDDISIEMVLSAEKKD